MESGKERKVCFIASSGGHWEELMCLKSVAQKYDAFYVTEEGGQANDASANLDKIYTFPQINRYESFRLKKMNKVPSRLKSVQLDITSTWSYNTSKWT